MIPHRKASETDENSIEQEIDAALQLLNRADPPAALQGRLNVRVSALAAHRLPSHPGRHRKTLSTVFGAFATLACACLLVVLLQPAHRYRNAAPTSTATLNSHTQSVRTAVSRFSTTPTTPTLAPVPIQVFHLALTTQASSHASRPKAPPFPQDLAFPTQAQLDAQALADTQASSHPAPTLELTAQERQIRLMLRRGERHDLAELDARHQQLFEEQRSTELSRFFNPVIPRDHGARDLPPQPLTQPTPLPAQPAKGK